MSCLHYLGRDLYIEQLSLKEIAKQFGTPCYVYSKTAITRNWQQFDHAFAAYPHRICYAVKANSNIAILNLLARLGSGFDIVSGGELKRVLHANGNPQRVIFSGVGKSKQEIEEAIRKNIYCFDVESIPELIRLQDIAAALNTIVPFALRINPNVDPRTHAHISTGLDENKFGIEFSEVIPICKSLDKFSALRLVGVACHIGSQISELEPFMLALDVLIETYQVLLTLDIHIKHLNIGGGLGITYRDEHPPNIHDFANAVIEKLTPYPLELILEPGRAIVGNAGVLLAQVEYLKHARNKNFAIVDAGMNDLIRPALYDAWQNILPVYQHDASPLLYDIAGPVCESADFLGKSRELSLQAGDYIAIDTAGAYGFSMSSNYNSRGRAAEVLVEHDKASLIRRRETIEELFAAETLLE